MHRNAARDATSSGSPIRSRGIRETAFIAASLSSSCFMGEKRKNMIRNSMSVWISWKHGQNYTSVDYRPIEHKLHQEKCNLQLREVRSMHAQNHNTICLADKALTWETRKIGFLTGRYRDVLIWPGAMQLALILSFAHSQARFLASWFIAPKIERGKSKSQTVFVERSNHKLLGAIYILLA